MRRKLLYAVGAISLVAFVAIGWGIYLAKGMGSTTFSYDKGQLIRFHVLANSDSAHDQQLKLYVRDGVIAYLAPYLENVKDHTEAQNLVNEQKAKIEEVANDILASHGADYRAKVQIGMFDFPIKSYGDLVLPAGKYEAVRILIGDAEGKNWWCVLFPPLCFIDITNAAAVVAPGENVQSGSREVQFKSKLVEVFNKKDEFFK